MWQAARVLLLGCSYTNPDAAKWKSLECGQFRRWGTQNPASQFVDSRTRQPHTHPCYWSWKQLRRSTLNSTWSWDADLLHYHTQPARCFFDLSQARSRCWTTLVLMFVPLAGKLTWVAVQSLWLLCCVANISIVASAGINALCKNWLAVQ